MATVLQREMYTESAAARLLDLAQSTLHYWLEGGRQNGRTYPPVIREQATGSNAVTWAEFIEAGLLRQYRRAHQVPMVEVRGFITNLRDTMGVPYPLASAQPFVSGKQLVAKAQEDVGLSDEFALVHVRGGQYLLTPPAREFYKRVVWRNNVASAWRPMVEPRSPVIIDPDIRFGRPSVDGISTETLAELVDAGEDDREVARWYGLTPAKVKAAVRYQHTARAA